MSNELALKLNQLNFNDSEVVVYLYLLEHGVSSVAQVSSKTRILRTNCYAILNKLVQKGLVEERKEGKHIKFIPKNPKAIIQMIEFKKQMALEMLIPELTNIFKSQKNKPVIKFYEGKDEMINEIFTQMYDTEEILGFTSTAKLLPLFPEFFKKWRKELRNRKIFLRDILSADSAREASSTVKKDLGIYVEHRFLPPKYQTLPTDILIWNDNVAFITLEEPIFGTVIHNKHIADTARIQFELIWATLKN